MEYLIWYLYGPNAMYKRRLRLGVYWIIVETRQFKNMNSDFRVLGLLSVSAPKTHNTWMQHTRIRLGIELSIHFVERGAFTSWPSPEHGPFWRLGAAPLLGVETFNLVVACRRLIAERMSWLEVDWNNIAGSCKVLAPHYHRKTITNATEIY